MFPELQQLVRYTRIRDIVGDVIRLQARGVALGDMAEVTNVDGEISLARSSGWTGIWSAYRFFPEAKGCPQIPPCNFSDIHWKWPTLRMLLDAFFVDQGNRWTEALCSLGNRMSQWEDRQSIR